MRQASGAGAKPTHPPADLLAQAGVPQPLQAGVHQQPKPVASEVPQAVAQGVAFKLRDAERHMEAEAAAAVAGAGAHLEPEPFDISDVLMGISPPKMPPTLVRQPRLLQQQQQQQPLPQSQPSQPLYQLHHHQQQPQQQPQQQQQQQQMPAQPPQVLPCQVSCDLEPGSNHFRGQLQLQPCDLAPELEPDTATGAGPPGAPSLRPDDPASLLEDTAGARLTRRGALRTRQLARAPGPDAAGMAEAPQGGQQCEGRAAVEDASEQPGEGGLEAGEAQQCAALVQASTSGVVGLKRGRGRGRAGQQSCRGGLKRRRAASGGREATQTEAPTPPPPFGAQACIAGDGHGGGASAPPAHSAGLGRRLRVRARAAAAPRRRRVVKAGCGAAAVEGSVEGSAATGGGKEEEEGAGRDEEEGAEREGSEFEGGTDSGEGSDEVELSDEWQEDSPVRWAGFCLPCVHTAVTLLLTWQPPKVSCPCVAGTGARSRQLTACALLHAGTAHCTQGMDATSMRWHHTC